MYEPPKKHATSSVSTFKFSCTCQDGRQCIWTAVNFFECFGVKGLGVSGSLWTDVGPYSDAFRCTQSMRETQPLNV